MSNSNSNYNSNDLSKQLSGLAIRTASTSSSSSGSNSKEVSPKAITPTQSHSLVNTPTSPMITPSHSQLNSDIQARIMAFQQKRSGKRGGLKMNINDRTPDRSPDTLSPPVMLNEDRSGPKSSGEISRRLSERKKKPNFKLNLSEDSSRTSSRPNSNDNNPNDSNETKSNDNTIANQNNEPRQPQLQGLFANYSKYIDIKSGSLKFTGKASLNSTGIDFSSGTSFRISLDQLQFIEELGRGNYGTVSKVLHKPTGVLMAMKEVRLELDESKFTQILMELEVLHKCHSPYIVDFYGAFFVEGAVYMCIENMDGESLDKVYEKDVGIKDESHLAYISECIIRGLKELKDNHNIIHRDVKPTNILVNSNGKVKLCDFGVSGNLVSSLAKTNIGCQSYMAPERIKTMNPDDNTYSVQSDIWSLGLTILEIAKGNYPYPAETYENIFSQLSAMVDGEPPKLDANLFSKEAQQFVQSCLNKNPDLRPSYQDLLEHPWLVKYKDTPMASFEAYVKERINKSQLEKKLNRSGNKPRENVSSILKGKVRAPALHRGGLFTNNRSFVNR
ncbi:kinase-like protein [Yamadazyma tenuis ATCC 10573]|uniref:mitogen-activated protein kinase kinase n=1 Tax=Candida tenuis (strain ATCC 10573 / BCRC 21748 / CBS 615 / JCM 9827 / NBRC 10315 / NRRL Y-1498 / VKM Y-70) TaxID=590646 RepID=G3B634_CANTC|nr:kinase-like protein [Yamadazyma tenuis ATCC 10573]EGV63369.1 kinase-like protein [Yamadazyma tenuis ATCC 10573]